MFLNQGRLDDGLLEKVQQLKPIAEREGLSLAQLALAWILRNDNVSSVIVGATKPEQLADNAGASGKVLSPETLAEIDALFPL
jgi:aryl-alcohol dehydrogenase-like predicted oxidoreductase